MCLKIHQQLLEGDLLLIIWKKLEQIQTFVVLIMVVNIKKLISESYLLIIHHNASRDMTTQHLTTWQKQQNFNHVITKCYNKMHVSLKLQYRWVTGNKKSTIGGLMKRFKRNSE